MQSRKKSQAKKQQQQQQQHACMKPDEAVRHFKTTVLLL